MIDTSGEWWVGTGSADIAEYLTEYGAGGYDVHEVTDSACAACGGRTFRVEINADSLDGARRTCVGCGAAAFIADSGDYWDGVDGEDHEIEAVACPCDGDVYEVAVGFSLRGAREDVKWISVGLRCVADGVLSCPVDWKIDYSPSLQLLRQA